MNNEAVIKRALIGVSDKRGVTEFARELAAMGIEIVATGGTQAELKRGSVPVRPVEDFTGFPEILGGRVKTLHPKIHGGILARRDDPEHLRELSHHGLEPIDMVVVNFYPFEQTVARPGVSTAEVVESIDIGGPTLVRAAAKNYAHVATVVDPDDYPRILAELRAGKGRLSAETRWQLAAKAFALVSAYDAAIAEYFAGTRDGAPGSKKAPELGPMLSLSFHRAKELRYGENPHQRAALYGNFLSIAEPLHGKELSFNNVVDINWALNLIADFADYEDAVVAILKHNSPCGVGVAASPSAAWDKAFATDPDSPFGGIVITNRTFDLELANRVNEIFTEVLIAPEFSPDALEVLRRKRDRRLVRFHPERLASDPFEFRHVAGGVLVQTPDRCVEDPRQGKVVTRRAPSEAEYRAMAFGIRVCKHVRSNAIVFAREDRTLAIGGGGTSRIDPLYAAREKAGRLGIDLRGSVLASEAFFPFPDGPILAAEAGATAIAQPGGSVRDDAVVEAANERGLAMVFTGVRHFRH